MLAAATTTADVDTPLTQLCSDADNRQSERERIKKVKHNRGRPMTVY